MQHINISFIILHYLVSDQTKKCIDSIKKNIDTDNYLIVIVDNFSNNGSIEEIEKYVKDDEKITILKNKQNLGFANGNNAGIKYINQNYNCDFICVLNNDVYLKSTNIYSEIKDEYVASSFAVAGPKIFTKDGKTSSNPKGTNIFTYKSVKHRQIEINVYYFLYKIHLDRVVQLLEKRKMPKSTTEKKENNNKIYKVQLHGCFYIFSKKYFEYFDGFDSRTFLYMEEEILFQHLLNKNLVSVYLPQIEVFHEEDASTNAMLQKRPRTKQIFFLKHHRKSIRVLLNIIKKS